MVEGREKPVHEGVDQEGNKGPCKVDQILLPGLDGELRVEEGDDAGDELRSQEAARRCQRDPS